MENSKTNMAGWKSRCISYSKRGFSIALLFFGGVIRYVFSLAFLPLLQIGHVEAQLNLILQFHKKTKKPGSHRMSWDAPLPSKSGKWRFLPPSKIDIDPPKIAIFRAGDYFFHTFSHHFGYPFVNLCGASWLGKHGWSIWEASHGSVENSTWRAVAMATWCFHRPRRLSNEKRVPRCLRYGI